MTPEKAQYIIEQGEGLNIEFKSCTNKIGSSVYDTVCSFLNHTGGHIFIGVDDNGDILGVDDKSVDGMIRNFINIISSPDLFFPKAFIIPEVLTIDDKKIIYLYVEEGAVVYRYKKFFFDRIGDADIDISQQSGLLSNLFARKCTSYTENKIIPYLTLENLDNETFDLCRKIVTLKNPTHSWITLSNEEILKSIGLFSIDPSTGEQGLKLAALLLFGKESAISEFYAIYRIEAIYRNNTYYEFIENNSSKTNRYDDRVTIRKNILQAYSILIDFTLKHLPDKFHIEFGETQRTDLRINIFREVVANLLVHREYTNPMAGTLEIFSDRVITNNWSRHIPSQKSGIINIDDLMNYTKNPLLVKTFRELGWVEELGSGSRNIKKYAPLYYKDSKVEIDNTEKFVFSITYRDSENVGNNNLTSLSVKNGLGECVNFDGKSVNGGIKGVNVDDEGVNCGAKSVNSNTEDASSMDIQSVDLISLREELFKIASLKMISVTKVIKKRMSEELLIIYTEGHIDKASLLKKLEYTDSKMKGDLRMLLQYDIITLNHADKSYSLSASTIESLSL